MLLGIYEDTRFKSEAKKPFLKCLDFLGLGSGPEFEQKFKALINQTSFFIPPHQHKEWFIISLVPHIRLSFMKQKMTMQVEAFETTIKL